jgi:hypothetical protein
LTLEERQTLIELVSAGKNNAQKIKHANANILLAVDESQNKKLSDQEVGQRFHCHANTVANIRERFVEEGFECAPYSAPLGQGSLSSPINKMGTKLLSESFVRVFSQF